MKESQPHLSVTRWTARRAATLRWLARAALTVAAAGAMACGGDSSSGSTTGPGPTPTPSTAAGSYAMSTVNGKGLPVAVASDTSGLYKYEIMSGTISLTGDGKYSVVTNYRQTIPGNISLFADSTGGTWTQTGTSIALVNSQDGSKDSAVWSSAGQLTFNELDGTTSTTFIYAIKK